MYPKIYSKFVRTAFIKKAKTDARVLKKALGAESKVIYGPDYTHMTDVEINRDVHRFNLYRAKNERGKDLASQYEIKQAARQIQDDYLVAEAKKREASFRQGEEKREEAMLSSATSAIAAKEIKDVLRAKRRKETAKLNEDQKKKNIQEANRRELEDMAID